jgi:arsenite methyltransferase
MRATMEKETIKKVVREGYARIASGSASCCCTDSAPSCCGQKDVVKEISSGIGYTQEDLEKVPEGSNLGLGCGNPVALASLKKGEVVLDLGSGAGFDCFLASGKVGPKGAVIGVDMTPEMIDKSRQLATKNSIDNVEFRLGEIENLPVADAIIDIVISNCVINLSTDKQRVFKEAFRVLKKGGRILVSDIVLAKELPDYIKNNMKAYVGCVSGAIIKDEYLNSLRQAGFAGIEVIEENIFPTDYIISENLDKLKDLNSSILSIRVSAKKP